MGIITGIYKKNFLKRFDRDAAVPYYTCGDFPGLISAGGSFRNEKDVTVKYFIYNYEQYDKAKLILFCPGMGPGHAAYFSEIAALCEAGFRVLTLDYTGCGESGGEKLDSVNRPARDVVRLLSVLDPAEEIIPVGHSLGGYTALTVANTVQYIRRAVIIAGFVGISEELMGYVGIKPVTDMVKRFEKKLDPEYGSKDNLDYLRHTDDKLLFIHSTDDQMVSYKYNAAKVIKLKRENVKVITVENKKHNPEYSPEALRKMNKWMGDYYEAVRKNRFESLEKRKAYFADKPIGEMTEQDPEVWGQIIDFIKN